MRTSLAKKLNQKGLFPLDLRRLKIKKFTVRAVKSVIVKAPETNACQSSTSKDAMESEEDPEACRTKENVLQGYKIPKKPLKKDKEVDAQPSVDQEIIEMNRIATARAARDTAVKDTPITKKMLVEAAIEKVGKQVRGTKTNCTRAFIGQERPGSGRRMY